MSGPPRSVARARLQVRAALGPLAAEHPGALVLVACSGGADSLALAVTTAFVAPRLGLRAGAVVVDHGLQVGSEEVAADAAARCGALGLTPVDVRSVQVATGPGTGGPEAAARDARYAALAAVADETGAVAILLGHTADDQAESVLLGLARGSGARSLSGMRPQVGRVHRPLLGLRRTETEDVCRAAGIGWWTDPTNAGDSPDAPLRSRVRATVVPLLDDVLGPGVVDALVRTADQLHDDDTALAALARELLDRALVDEADEEADDEGAADADRGRADPARVDPALVVTVPGPPSDPVRVSLDVEVLGAALPALRTRSLRLAALSSGCPAGALTRDHVLRVEELVTRWRGQGPLHLPGGVTATRVCGRLVLEPPHH